jgi:hypothetical protein
METITALVTTEELKSLLEAQIRLELSFDFEILKIKKALEDSNWLSIKPDSMHAAYLIGYIVGATRWNNL